MSLKLSVAARQERAFIETTLRRLRRERWLRLHVTALALLTLLGLMGISLLLRLLGVESLALRYALALPLTYMIYLGLLRLWASYLLSDGQPDATDALNMVDAPPLPRSSGGSPTIQAGGGGDFGGGGASASFAEDAGTNLAGSGTGIELPQGVDELAVDVTGKTVKLGAEALDSDESAVVVVPLLVVLAVGALLMTMLGLGIFALFGVDVLMGVALEVALAGLAGGFAWRRQREGWLGRALGQTWKAALAMVVLGVALGALLDHWVPQADSLPHALHLLRTPH